MDRDVPDLSHFLLQQSRHPHDHIPILRIGVAIQQFQRIGLTIKQLPLSALLAAGSRPFDVQIVIVPVNKLILMIADPVMRIRLVLGIIMHPVPMVRELEPVPGRSSLENGPESAPLHVRRGYYVCEIKERGSEIDIADNIVADTSWLDLAWVPYHKRHLETLFVHEAFVEPAVFAEEEALVRRVHDDGVFREFGIGVEEGQNPADIVVDALDRPEISLHVPLEFKFRELGLGTEGEDGAVFDVDQFDGLYFCVGSRGGHLSLSDREPFACSTSTAIRLGQAEVFVGEVVRDAHFGDGCGARAVLVIVRESVRELDLVFIQVFMLIVALPAPVRGFVMTHYEERPGRVSLLDKVRSHIGDDVRRVAFNHTGPFRLDELGIMVIALTR